LSAYRMEQKPMFIDGCLFFGLHRRGEHATHPIAHISELKE
jgi:hypothetical protein